MGGFEKGVRAEVVESPRAGQAAYTREGIARRSYACVSHEFALVDDARERVGNTAAEISPRLAGALAGASTDALGRARLDSGGELRDGIRPGS